MHVLAYDTVVGESLWRKLLPVVLDPDFVPKYCGRCGKFGHLPEAHKSGKYRIERDGEGGIS